MRFKDALHKYKAEIRIEIDKNTSKEERQSIIDDMEKDGFLIMENDIKYGTEYYLFVSETTVRR